MRKSRDERLHKASGAAAEKKNILLKNKNMLTAIVAIAILLSSVAILSADHGIFRNGSGPLGDGPVWDGSAPYWDEANNAFNGDGTEYSPYLINSAKDLKLLANIVNSGNPDHDAVYNNSGVYYKLTTDLFLNNTAWWNVWGDGFIPRNTWAPIGGYSYTQGSPVPFAANFNGDSHKISGIYINSETGYQGLFGYATGSISGVTVEKSYIRGGWAEYSYEGGYVEIGYLERSSFTGGIVGFMDGGSIENCVNSGRISSAINTVGGIAGMITNGASIENCRNTGNISGEGGAGGIVGAAAPIYTGSDWPNTGTQVSPQSGPISNCRNSGSVEGKNNIGGIVGMMHADDSNSITGCSNSGAVFASAEYFGSSCNIGGIAGELKVYLDSASFIIEGCSNSGGVTGNCSIGGIAGTVEIPQYGELTITDCHNTGGVNGIGPYNDSIGGIAGVLRVDFEKWDTFEAGGDAIVTDCSNTGDISGWFDVAGIVGWTDGRSAIIDCWNAGGIAGRGYVGGITGELAYGSSVSNSYNIGNILCEVPEGNGYAGGIAGGIKELSSITDCYNTGNVTGSEDVGGIAGHVSNESSVANCFNIGKINGGQDAGGIAGLIQGPLCSVANCYNTGNITGLNTGGIAGYISDALVVNCYSTGTVTGAAGTSGAVAGVNNGTIEDGYYLSGTAAGAAGTISTGISGASEFSASGQLSVIMLHEALNTWVTSPTIAGDHSEWSEHGFPLLLNSVSGPGDVRRDESADIWDGIYAATVFPGTGTLSDPYIISTPAQLAWLSESVNTDADDPNGLKYYSAGKYYELANDIYLNDPTGWDSWDRLTAGLNVWRSIGYDQSTYTQHPFAGNFDGKGFVIYGMYQNAGNYGGVFGYVSGGSVRDLGVEQGFAFSVNTVGGVVGYVTGSAAVIRDCYNTGNVTGYGAPIYVGGVVGLVNGNAKVIDCYNTGNVTQIGTGGGSNINTGGVTAYIDGSASLVSNCYNTGNVTGMNNVGGIAGTTTNSGSILNCYNTGNVAGGEISGGSHTGGSYVGGLVGVNRGNITDSYNSGSVSGGSTVGGLAGMNTSRIAGSYNTANVLGRGYDIGGIAGSNDNVIINSYNSGNVIGDNDIGGVAGRSAQFSYIIDSYNTGSVTGRLYNIGGVAGMLDRGYVERSYNAGAVTGGEQDGGGLYSNGAYVGGIVGRLSCTDVNVLQGRVEDCGNTGSVKGGAYVGGLIGSIDSHAFVNNSYNTGYVVCHPTKDAPYQTGTHLGGLIGNAENAINVKISNCYNSGDAAFEGNIQLSYPELNIGGIIGYVAGYPTKLQNCYNSGELRSEASNSGPGSANVIAGGMIGRADPGADIVNCYNAGTVLGNAAGGMIGIMTLSYGEFSMINCYNSGEINGDPYSTGTLIGMRYGESEDLTLEYCYYLDRGTYSVGGLYDELERIYAFDASGTILGWSPVQIYGFEDSFGALEALNKYVTYLNTSGGYQDLLYFTDRTRDGIGPYETKIDDPEIMYAFTENSVYVEGTVYDQNGDPLGGVNVYYTINGGPTGIYSAMTDAEGNYTITAETGFSVRIYDLRKSGYMLHPANQVARNIPSIMSGVSSVDFTMSEYHTVSGTVTEKDPGSGIDTPLPGVTIYYRIDGGPSAALSPATGYDGSYAVKVPYGSALYITNVTYPGYRLTAASAQVEFSVGTIYGDVTDIDFEMETITYSISGTVYMTDSWSPSGAEIVYYGDSGRQTVPVDGSTGSYTITAREGEYIIIDGVNYAGYPSYRLTSDSVLKIATQGSNMMYSDISGFDLYLEPDTYTISGTVIDAYSRQPLYDAQVKVYGYAGEVRTDAYGYYSMTVSGGDPIQIYDVEYPGYSVSPSSYGNLRDYGAIYSDWPNIDLEMERNSYTVSGYVYETDMSLTQSPLHGALISYLIDGVPGTAVTEYGYYSIPVLDGEQLKIENVEYEIDIYNIYRLTAGSYVNIRDHGTISGNVSGIDFEMEPDVYTVTGYVYLNGWAGVEDAKISYLVDGYEEHGTYTNYDGSYTITVMTGRSVRIYEAELQDTYYRYVPDPMYYSTPLPYDYDGLSGDRSGVDFYFTYDNFTVTVTAADAYSGDPVDITFYYVKGYWWEGDFTESSPSTGSGTGQFFIDSSGAHYIRIIQYIQPSGLNYVERIDPYNYLTHTSETDLTFLFDWSEDLSSVFLQGFVLEQYTSLGIPGAMVNYDYYDHTTATWDIGRSTETYGSNGWFQIEIGPSDEIMITGIDPPLSGPPYYIGVNYLSDTFTYDAVDVGVTPVYYYLEKETYTVTVTVRDSDDNAPIPNVTVWWRYSDEAYGDNGTAPSDGSGQITITADRGRTVVITDAFDNGLIYNYEDVWDSVNEYEITVWMEIPAPDMFEVTVYVMDNGNNLIPGAVIEYYQSYGPRYHTAATGWHVFDGSDETITIYGATAHGYQDSDITQADFSSDGSLMIYLNKLVTVSGNVLDVTETPFGPMGGVEIRYSVNDETQDGEGNEYAAFTDPDGDYYIIVTEGDRFRIDSVADPAGTHRLTADHTMPTAVADIVRTDLVYDFEMYIEEIFVIAGTIYNADGSKTVDDAEVWYQIVDGDGTVMESGKLPGTGTDGRFEFPEIIGEKFVITKVTAPGYKDLVPADLTVWTFTETNTNVRIYLEYASFIVSGYVTDQGVTGLGGVNVVYTVDESATEHYDVFTDPDGYYEIDADHGEHSVTIIRLMLDDYSTVSSPSVLTYNHTEPNVNFRMAHNAFTVSGYVTDQYWKAGIVGATVSYTTDDATGPLSVTTGPGGYYVISASFGAHTVIIEGVTVNSYYVTVTEPAVKEYSHTATNVNYVLMYRHFSISGYVTDTETGDGLFGVSVSYTLDGEGGIVHTTKTVEDGYYAIFATHGEHFVTILGISFDDHETVSGPSIMVYDNTAADADFEMKRIMFEVTGTVTDEDGDPIEGAEVYYRTDGGPEMIAGTDENGNYVIHAELGKTVKIVKVMKRGYLTVTADEDHTETGYRDFEMEDNSFTVSGTVAEHEGSHAPIAGAKVSYDIGGDELYTETDADGHYAISAEKGEKITILMVEKRGFGTITASDEYEDDATDDFEMDDVAFYVKGNVTDGDTGTAIEGAEIRYIIGGEQAFAITDEYGDYEITGEIGTTITIIEVAKRGYRTVIAEDHLGTGENVFTGVSLHDTFTADFEMDDISFTVSGIVTDDEGDPIPNAEIWYTIDGGDEICVITDPDGKFEILGTDGEEIEMIDVITKGYRLTDRTYLRTYSEGTDDIEFVMEDSKFRVTGTVSDGETGSPLEGAEVWYEIEGDELVPAITDQYGQYEIFSYGDPVIIAHLYYQNYELIGDVPEDPFTSDDTWDCEMAHKKFTVFGTVTEYDGAADLIGATVRYTMDGDTNVYEAEVEGSGYYNITVNMGRTVTITDVTYDDHIRVTALPPSYISSHRWDFQMTYGEFTVSGHVTDIRDGSAIPGTTVVQYRLDGDDTVYSAPADADGYFEISADKGRSVTIVGVVNDDYNCVTALPPAFTTSRSQNFSMSHKQFIVSGYVTDNDTGDGLEGAAVQYRLDGGDTVYEALAGADGYYEITNDTGRYVMMVGVTYPNRTISTSLPPSAFTTTQTYNFRMTRDTFTVSGTVTDDEGDPIKNAKVWYKRGDGTEAYAETDENGEYVITEYAGDTVELTKVERTGYGTYHLKVPQIFGGNAEDIDFTLEDTFTVSGTVTDENGDPINKAKVWYRVNGGEIVFEETDEDGNFVIRAEIGDTVVIVRITADLHTDEAPDGLPGFGDNTADLEFSLQTITYGVTVQSEPGKLFRYRINDGEWTGFSTGRTGKYTISGLHEGDKLDVEALPGGAYGFEWDDELGRDHGNLISFTVHGDIVLTGSFSMKGTGSWLWIAAAAMAAVITICAICSMTGRPVIRGSVSYGGRPIKDAVIGYTVSGEPAGEVRTGEDGSFEINAPDGSEVVITSIEADGNGVTEKMPVSIFMERDLQIDLSVRK